MASQISQDEGSLPKLEDYAQSLQIPIEALEKILQPILDTPLGEISAKLSTVDRAKLQALYAQTIATLLSVYLRTRGIDPLASHPIKEQMDRIKSYANKIQDTINPPKRLLKMDRQAAARHIKGNLPPDERKRNQESDRGKGVRDRQIIRYEIDYEKETASIPHRQYRNERRRSRSLSPTRGNSRPRSRSSPSRQRRSRSRSPLRHRRRGHRDDDDSEDRRESTYERYSSRGR